MDKSIDTAISEGMRDREQSLNAEIARLRSALTRQLLAGVAIGAAFVFGAAMAAWPLDEPVEPEPESAWKAGYAKGAQETHLDAWYHGYESGKIDAVHFDNPVVKICSGGRCRFQLVDGTWLVVRQ